MASVYAFFRGHYDLLLWLLICLAIGATYIVSGKSKKLFTISAISILGGFMVQHFVLAPRNRPFSFGIEVALVGQTRDSNFVAEYAGHFVSPISLILFVRIVNQQDIPSTISDLRIEVYSGSRWWGLRRRWLELSLLPADMPLLVLDSPNAPLANKLTLLGTQLKAVLESGSIGAHGTLRGWALFDAPPSFDSAPRPLMYRVTITDTAGHTLRMVVKGATAGGDIFTGNGFKLGAQVPVPPNLIIRHFFYPSSY